MTTTIAPGIGTRQCSHEGKLYDEGNFISSTHPCTHCYCFGGDIACAVQDCGTPMKTHGKNCTALPPPEGECCPTTYQCGKNSIFHIHQFENPLSFKLPVHSSSNFVFPSLWIITVLPLCFITASLPCFISLLSLYNRNFLFRE